MNRNRRKWLFALFALGIPAAGTGQESRDWRGVRDSLAQVSDVVMLRRLQSRLPMPGLAAGPEAVIERGLIRLRIWELTRDELDADLSVDVFEAGSDRFPRSSWMRYGLALAYAGQAESRLEGESGLTVGRSLAELLRRDPVSRSRQAALAALELEPTLADAAVLLARLAVRDGRDVDALVEAKRALEAQRRQDRGGPDVVRALADVETALGNYGGAEAALAAVTGSDASSSHARAVALLLQEGRERAGAEAYFEAVDSLDEEAARRLYRDAEPIAVANEAADWAVADLEGRRSWLRRFWSRRAAESGVTEGERLAEHYRRLALARREYLRNSRRGVDGGGVLLSESWVGDSPFDDRGLVLLKRGLPERMIRTRADGVLPNETWVYRDPDGSGNLLFHFAALRGTRDYNLLSDLLQAIDPLVDPVGEYGRFRTALLTLVGDRAAYEPRYQVAEGRLRSELQQARILDATEIRTIFRTVIESAEADYRRDARQALAADAHFARFDRDLPFHFDLFTFRAPFGRTDLTAAFAVPAQAAAAIEEGDRFAYPLEISVILLDTLSDGVTRRDTLARVVPGAADPTGHLRAYVTMPVSPSDDNVYRVVVRSPAIGAGAVYAGSARLKDYTGLGLQISDLVLASPEAAGGWRRGDLRLDVTLPRRFEPARPFTLYYEIYNLAQDSPYRTRLTVDPVAGGGPIGALKRLLGFGGPRVDLSFEERALPDADGGVPQLRDLGTDLPPGRYRMRVQVTDDATGERAESETVFEVVR